MLHSPKNQSDSANSARSWSKLQLPQYEPKKVTKEFEVGLMWFRRDLRVSDNAALSQALQRCRRVFAAFVFDTDILAKLPRQDRRVVFIWESVSELRLELEQLGGGLIARHGSAEALIPILAEELQAQVVFANHDYEPQAVSRDVKVAVRLSEADRKFLSFKDQVIFEKDEVLTASGNFYSVFSPYKRNWLGKVNERVLKELPVEPHSQALAGPRQEALPALDAIGFDPQFRMPIAAGARAARQLFDEFLTRIDQYQMTRNYPAVKGPSYLSVHLRFGTISIRQLARAACQRVQQFGNASSDENGGASTWLGELIWRDFYFQILHHRPYVVDGAFRPEYDRIKWDNDAQLFAAWCDGRTGFPIVDAAMVQLNSTGYMHNRLRMVVASFLTKDLGIDWRWGERYFAEKLNDFDLSANNGGWQWAASSGCDAQPYFRIFNPTRQSETFDADGKFIKRYLPVLADLPKKFIHEPALAGSIVQSTANCTIGVDYPAPVVVHAEARKRTLERYSVVKTQ